MPPVRVFEVIVSQGFDGTWVGLIPELDLQVESTSRDIVGNAAAYAITNATMLKPTQFSVIVSPVIDVIHDS